MLSSKNASVDGHALFVGNNADKKIIIWEVYNPKHFVHFIPGHVAVTFCPSSA